MKPAIVIFLLIINCYLYAQPYTDNVLEQLNRTIQASSKYDAQKLAKIKSLEERLNKQESADPFQKYLELYNEYQVFNYDSAYTYSCTKCLPQQLNRRRQ